MVRFFYTAAFCALFTLGAFFSTINSARAITIDEFSSSAPVSLFSMSAGVEESRIDLSSTQVLGGGRKLRALSNSSSSFTILAINSGQYLHSQPATGTGMTAVVWDGAAAIENANASRVEINKLNGTAGVDFYQDGGTKVRVKVSSFDFAGRKPITVSVRIYDSRNAGSISVASYQLNEQIGLTTPPDPSVKESMMLEFPFGSFAKEASATTTADFHHVGAVMLHVNGTNPDSDLTVDFINTDGACALIPDGAGKVIDDCGVCGGNNKDKDSCGVCFGLNKALDQCGICFGQNSTVDDCGICGGGNLSKDACGVCGGDNKKCTDCMGVPNGPAKIDECGICNGDGKSCLDCAGVPFGTAVIDCCGVCDGDGSSCEDKCKVYNLVATKKKLSSSVIKLYDTVKKYSTQEHGCIKNASGKRVAATRIKIAKEILKSSQEDLADYYQDKVKICDTIFCSKVKLQSVGRTLKKNVDKLYQLSRWAQYGAGKACKTKNKTKKQNSLKEYQNASVSIKGLPDEKCE